MDKTNKLNETLERLKPKFIKELSLKCSPDDLREETALFGEHGLGLDSLDSITISLILESEFGIVEEPEDIPREHLSTLGKLSEYILSHPTYH